MLLWRRLAATASLGTSICHRCGPRKTKKGKDGRKELDVHVCEREKERDRRVPLWHRGLRIWHCHYSSLVCCCGRGFIPGWRTSTCHRHRQKKKKKKTQTQNQVRQFLILYYHKWCCNVHSVHMSPGICMIISLEQISRDKRAGSYSMLLGTAK